MISATEALRLPSAQLSAEEKTAADTLTANLEAHILAKMERGGTGYQTPEMRAPVLAEVALRIRESGWLVQMGSWMGETALSREQRRIGTSILMTPTDEAYRAADARGAA